MAREHKPYKINIGDIILVRRREIKGIIFYCCSVKQRNYDGTSTYFYKRLKFKKGVELQDNTKIKINSMFENLIKNPKDEFNPIMNLMILDFDIIEDKISDDEALENYQDEIFNEESFDDIFF